MRGTRPNAAAFLEALGRVVRRVRPVVVAMRADRLAEVSAYPAFARLVERGLYLLGAMSEAACGRRSRRRRGSGAC